MKNIKKAERILAAIDSSTVPISWHSMYDEELVEVIAAELNRMEKEEGTQDE